MISKCRRVDVAHACAAQISVFTDGVLAREKTLLGAIQVGSDDAAHKDLVA